MALTIGPRINAFLCSHSASNLMVTDQQRSMKIDDDDDEVVS